MKLVKVSENAYADTEGLTGGNVGVIILDDGVVAVDAQYPASATLFREQIREVTDKHVTHLLLTHVHGDHVFGNQAFEDADIVAHRRLGEKMEENLKTIWAPGELEKMVEETRRKTPERAWLFEGLRIVLPKTVFSDTYAVGPVKMIHTGGHTDCSSIVYYPDDKLLFSGDILFVGRFPWAGDPTADPDDWIEAFRTMLKLDARTIVPGHGPLCDKSEVEKQLGWFKAVRAEMRAQIASGASEDEAVGHGYPALYPSDRPEWVEGSLRRWFRVWKGRDSSSQSSTRL